MKNFAIGCVDGVYGVLRRFIIGFDEVLFTTYNLRNNGTYNT